MLAVTGATPAEVAALVEIASEGDDVAALGVVNGPRHTVVSGSPDALRRFRAAVEKRAAAEAAEIEAKTRGGRAFAPTVEAIPVAIGFHHPSLAPAVAMVRTWAEACGLDAGLAEHLAHAICVETVDWPRELTDAVGAETRFVVDLGPSDLSANLTGRALRGRGITVIPAATEKGRDVLFTAGAEVRTAADWSTHAPRLIDRGDGSPVVDTAFTRLTGKSPILLAGMTPTTVDPRDRRRGRQRRPLGRARGRRPGHRADLRRQRRQAHRAARRGRTAQFNTLFLDPYLWKMQVGSQRLLQKARLAGAPVRRAGAQRRHPRPRGRRRDHRGPARRRHQPRRVQARHREADPPGAGDRRVRSTPR